jgi:hypothetical protein
MEREELADKKNMAFCAPVQVVPPRDRNLHHHQLSDAGKKTKNSRRKLRK